MWVSKITNEDLTNDVIDRLLFEGLNDNGASVDCIIVLGSIKAAAYRVPAAAKAFFSGRSEKLMLCGGKMRNFSSEGIGSESCDMHVEESLDVTHPLLIDAVTQAQPVLCRNKESLDVTHPLLIDAVTQAQPVLCRNKESMAEADNMYKKALELGVPEKSIIIEKNSQNTIENILCSLLELQRSMWLNKVKSVLLVTTTYHMRRSLHIAKYLFPSHISVYPCPADDTTTKRDNWMNTPEGINRVKSS